MTEDDSWPNLAACSSLLLSLLPDHLITRFSCYNLSWQHAQPECLSARFSSFSLAVYSMTIPFLILLQTGKLFSPLSLSPDRDMHFSCSHCHWSHLSTKMPLLSHSLPFLLLLFLLLSALLNNPVSKPFLCSHIALRNDFPRIVSPEKFWEFLILFPPSSSDMDDRVLMTSQSHRCWFVCACLFMLPAAMPQFSVSPKMLLTKLCSLSLFSPLLNFPSYCDQASFSIIHCSWIQPLPWHSSLPVHQHLHATFCPFPLQIALLILSWCCDSFPPFPTASFILALTQL